jgi:TolB-like protein
MEIIRDRRGMAGRQMSFFAELRRRNVFRVAIAYLAAGWLLTEVASTVFPLFGVPEWGIRFIVVLLALGFLPALVISWVYELTPEGLKRERDVIRDESITQVTAKRLDGITIGVVLLALVVVAADRLYLGPKIHAESATAQPAQPGQAETAAAPSSAYPPGSIAVLPFVNMSDDPANEFFADGISEEMLNLLATIPELRVTARTSSFSFKGKGATIAEIARQLGVAHVLEGSVRKDGDRVRVTAQLIETGAETHLWSAAYDRTLDDIFAIQDEIAREVVGSLRVTLLGEDLPRIRETDPEAYVLYLQCNNFRAGSLEELRRGEQYCRQSLEIDPDYAPAWEALGNMYTNLAVGGGIDYEEGFAQAKRCKRRALELDPGLASAHAGLAWAAMIYDRDLPTAAKHYRAALEIAPGDHRVLGGAAVFAETLGQFERAIELADQALAVNPLGYVVYGNIAIVYCYIGQFEQANERFEKYSELGGGLEGNHWRARCWLQQGEPDKALAEAKAIQSVTRRLWVLSMAYYDLGRIEESDRALNALIEGYADEAAAFIAENYAWRGEIEPAFDWLDRAIEEKQYMWGSLVFDPAFSKLHADPRWQDIRTRDGRSEEQLKQIDF